MMIGNAKCDVMRTQELVNVVVIPARRSVHEFDGASLQAFLTLTDLHQHPLAFCQPAQPAALKRRRMDENILPAAIRSNEAKPFVGIVHFNRTDAFRRRPDTGLPLRR